MLKQTLDQCDELERINRDIAMHQKNLKSWRKALQGMSPMGSGGELLIFFLSVLDTLII